MKRPPVAATVTSPDTSPDAAAGRFAGMVGAGILVSRLAGFVRTWFIARYLGLSAENDAYMVAQRVPNAIRNLLGEGTLSAAFVPVYSALLGHEERRAADGSANSVSSAARTLANALLGVLLVMVSVLTLVGIAAAPVLTDIIAGGFSPEKAALTTRLMRVMFPMAGLMVISGWCLGVQNSHRRFFMSYASAAMWSVAQIVLLAGWGGRAESLAQLAWWLAWATLAGAALQVAVQLPEVWRLSGPLRPVLDAQDENVRAVLRNLVPVIGALGVVQLSGFADTFIASWLPDDGAITALGYANQTMLLPVALFGIAVSASSLPDLSRAQPSSADEHVRTAQRESARARVQQGWLRILFYIVPSALVFIAFGDLLIGMLFVSGRFGIAEQTKVHAVLAAYAVGLVAFASNRLFATVFHAARDYRTPLRFAVASVSLSILLAALFAFTFRAHPLAAAGIALGAAIGAWLNFVLLSAAARRMLGALLDSDSRRTVVRIVLLTVLATALALALRMLLPELHRWIEGPIVLGCFSLAYLASSWWYGSGEAARWLRLRPRSSASGGAR